MHVLRLAYWTPQRVQQIAFELQLLTPLIRHPSSVAVSWQLHSLSYMLASSSGCGPTLRVQSSMKL